MPFLPLYKQETIRTKSHKEWGSEKEKKTQEAQMQKALEKKKLEIETARKEEELKNAKWTRDDLMKLVYQQEKILDDHFWEPQAFGDDITLIQAQIAKEKWEIKLEGVKKDEISVHGIDFLYGLLLQAHIFNCWFYIEINDQYQPILHDNQIPERTAQLQWLQAQLDNHEFGVERGSILRKNDNTPKIATYITALSYHGQPEKNLIKYRENTEKKIQKDPNKPLSADEIKKSDLTPGQKTFLLIWQDRKNDRNLGRIQKNQERFVEHARQNFKEKSPEEHLQELDKTPIRKSMELFWAGVIGIALLAYGLKQMFGEKSGVMGKIFGTILALIGWSMVYKKGDSLWQAFEGPEMLNGLTTKEPIDKARANDNPYARAAEKIPKQFEGLKKKITLMHERLFSGPDVWTPLLMKKDVGPKIATYPAGALLYALNEDKGMRTEMSEFSAYRDNPEMQKIKDTISKLSSTEKGQLLALMTESWQRQKELNSGKIADDITKDNSDPKKLTLTAMISEIDDRDSWWNTLPSWVGWKNGLLSQNTQKTEALKVMAPKIGEWGDVTIGDLKKYFGPSVDGDTAERNASPVKKLLEDRLTVKASASAETTIRHYVESTDFWAAPDTTTLRDFLKS